MESSKVWKIVGAAGLIIVSGATVAYMLSENDEQRIARWLKKDIETLGTISKDSTGTIKVQDFIELFKIITKYSKQKIQLVKSK